MSTANICIVIAIVVYLLMVLLIGFLSGKKEFQHRGFLSGRQKDGTNRNCHECRGERYVKLVVDGTSGGGLFNRSL